MLLVTGGLLYSNVVAALNVAGPTDIAVCDFLGKKGKWRNLAKRQIAAFVPPAELENWLKGRRLDTLIHIGAISEDDGDGRRPCPLRPISISRCHSWIGARLDLDAAVLRFLRGNFRRSRAGF